MVGAGCGTILEVRAIESARGMGTQTGLHGGQINGLGTPSIGVSVAALGASVA